MEYLIKGIVDAHAVPSLISNLGAMEVYNGNIGPGILNGIFAMNRAQKLRKKMDLA